MSFEINESKTPILSQQPQAVQDLARQFVQNYTSKNSIKVRAAWGSILEQIQEDLRCVTTGKGDKARQLDSDETFAGICRELGIPRSTAYTYIQTHIAVSNYPQVIQDAAANAGLNLALPHVMAEYQKMSIPTDPSPLELKGIIAQLEEVKPPEKKPGRTNQTPQQRFEALLKEAFEFAKDHKLGVEVVTSSLEELLAASLGMPGAKVTREVAPVYRQQQVAAEAEGG